MMKNIIPFLSENEIQSRVKEMAQSIHRDYDAFLEKNQAITVICILNGSFIFFSDLIRFLERPLICEFLGISSYQHMTSSGEIKITLDFTEPLEGKHVLLVEDIVDTGLTLSYLKRTLTERKPASLKICALLQKNHLETPLDYVGFKIGNEFVVGYGLDFNGKYRGLPYIGKVE